MSLLEKMSLHFSIEVKVSKFDKNPRHNLEHLIHSTEFVCNIGGGEGLWGLIPPWISYSRGVLGPHDGYWDTQDRKNFKAPPHGQIPEFAPDSPDLIQSWSKGLISANYGDDG